MNTNFDLPIRNASMDAQNWKKLGALQRDQEFEVDFYGHAHTTQHLGESKQGVVNKLTSRTFQALRGLTEISDELAARGLVRISKKGPWGEAVRKINQVWFGTIANFADNIKWLDNFITVTLTDVATLRILIQEAIPENLPQDEKLELQERKIQLFTVIESLRKDVASCKNLVNNLKITYAEKPGAEVMFQELDKKMNHSIEGLIPRVEMAYVEALNQIPAEAFNQPPPAVEDFELVARSHPIDTRTFLNRPSVLTGWKECMQKPILMSPFKEMDRSPIIFYAPDPLVLDLKRAYSYKINGQSYVCKDPLNEKKDYQRFYATLCEQLGENGAQRVSMLLNQSILGDLTDLMMRAEVFTGEKRFIYEVNIANGEVTLEVNYTFERRPMAEPEAKSIDGYYKVKGTFSLAELQAEDFYEKKDPLPSMKVTEIVDVFGLTPEQLQAVEGQQ